MKDVVTLAIPFYRGTAYLREAVESVLAQGDSSWRLLICDDGERDEARSVLEHLGLAGDPRIRCVRNEENLGMGGNWNRCLDLADADLVTLLHADDALAPHYVGLMRALARDHPDAVAFFCSARIVDASGRERFSFADWIKQFFLPPEARGAHGFALRGEPALAAVMAGNFIMCPTLCFRRARLGARRFDTRFKQVQDLAMTSGLLIDGETLVGTSSLAYTYRRHSAGATARQSESLLRFREELDLFEAVSQRAAQLGWSEAARVASQKRIVRLHLVYRALGHLLRGRAGQAVTELGMAWSGASKDGAEAPG